MDIYDILGISQLMEWGKEKLGLKQREEYHPLEVRPIKFNYRPQYLSEYVGQERAKDLINLTLEKIRTIKPIHILISGTKGCGKSTLAHIIANETKFDITWHIGGAFTMEALQQFLIKNQDSKRTQILFVDEIHNLPKELAEFLYPVIEDFILPMGNNPKLKSFIFMGATTEKNLLMKKFAPLVDRCGCDIVLETYKSEDIKIILKQYNDKLYQLNIDEEIYDILAKNTRFTPRIAQNFFDDLVVCKDINRVLNAHRVIKDGLTTTDIMILEHLKEVNKPVGIEALAMISGVTRADFNYIIEPYLISQGYISRTARGRIITNKGVALLEEIKCLK